MIQLRYLMRILFTTIFFYLFAINSAVEGQDNSAYIYGTITTDSDEKYTGYIRWGKEEMYWHDLFNAEKEENFQLPIKKKKEGQIWNNIDWSLGSIWKDNQCGSCNNNHVFVCMFGEISSIEILRGERAELTFKNGSTIIVDGSGTNDVETNIHMHDYELGKIVFDWDDLAHIQFAQAPDSEEPPYGSVLYGTVKTERRQSFSGYIQWDMDERNGSDILDGDTQYGDQKIPFEKIAQIIKINSGDAVEVTFQSGRTLELDGSNDCNNGNRGIGVYNPEIGNLEIEWDYFESLTFAPAPTSLVAYSQFNNSNNLIADVYTFDDEIHSGPIAYDKDEIWGFEMLDGDDGDIKMKIPFNNILKIIPKNRSFSIIYLKNDESYLLGDRQDVNYNNEGIIMLQAEEKGEHIEWENIDQILFK